MRCPTPCEECGAIVELSDMGKLRGGLGGFACSECFEAIAQEERLMMERDSPDAFERDDEM